MRHKLKTRHVVLGSFAFVIVLVVSVLIGINFMMNKALNFLAQEQATSFGNPQLTDMVIEDAEAKEQFSKSDMQMLGTGASVVPPSQVERVEVFDSDYQKSEIGGETEPKTYNPSISQERADEIAESVTIQEKAKVFRVVMKNLSTSDISRLRELAAGGLTSEEKQEARALMLERLSEDEYNELIAIAHKYGVSQGKTYEEVKKEEQ